MQTKRVSACAPGADARLVRRLRDEYGAEGLLAEILVAVGEGPPEDEAELGGGQHDGASWVVTDLPLETHAALADTREAHGWNWNELLVNGARAVHRERQ
jgi:hypothetical protein